MFTLRIHSGGGTVLDFMGGLTEVQDIYTADDTDGLFSFCADRGYIAMRED